jgi:hypothetical protein
MKELAINKLLLAVSYVAADTIVDAVAVSEDSRINFEAAIYLPGRTRR